MAGDARPEAVLIPVEDGFGIRVLHVDRIALVMEEHAGRVTVVTSGGEVLHRPGPLSHFQRPPWRRLDEGAVGHPTHATRVHGGYSFPGGWVVRPARAIGKAGREDGPLPEEILKVGRRAVNPFRIHDITRGPGGNQWRIRFADATGQVTDKESFTATRQGIDGLLKLLGLTRPTRIDPDSPAIRAMYRLGLRDYPCELMTAPAALLKASFASVQALIANVIWQAVRLREQGRPPDYGRDLRGFWYRPLVPAIERAGMARHDGGEVITLDSPVSLMGIPVDAPDRLYRQYLQILEDMVATHRLMTYHDLGMGDPRPERRRIGKRRPAVVLVVEKASLEEEAFPLAEAFGATVVVLGGQPSWLATEFFVASLLAQCATSTVRIVSLVDFDPGGWSLVATFVRQLKRYGVSTRDVHHLVRPERFSEEELQWVLRPLPAPTPEIRARILNWLRESGGVNGKGYGIHADHFRGRLRLARAFEEETGLKPLA